MPYSTLFLSIYTNSTCYLMLNTEILYLSESKKSKYYLGTPMLKTILLKILSVKKLYNAFFYSVLEYIHQVSMLSHVIYQYSNFMRIEKNLNNI